MPKSKSSSRTNSRKSTASSQGKPVILNVNEDEVPSIVITSSRKNTPKASRPTFLEPLSPVAQPSPPPPSPWERIGMTEMEYEELQTRVRKAFAVERKKAYESYLIADLENPVFWLRRLEHLEMQREAFNTKWGWSAAELACVERIDEEIKECEDELDRLYSEEDRIEVEYD